jgi:hypothetical protein
MFSFNSTIFHVPVQALKRKLFDNVKENAIIISSEFGILAAVFALILILLIKFKVITINNKIKLRTNSISSNASSGNAASSNAGSSNATSISLGSNNQASINACSNNATSSYDSSLNSSSLYRTTINPNDVPNHQNQSYYVVNENSINSNANLIMSSTMTSGISSMNSTAATSTTVKKLY